MFIKLILLLLLSGCAFFQGSSTEQYVFNLETEFLKDEPYCIGRYDCTEQTKRFMCFLDEKGIENWEIIQRNLMFPKAHSCVGWAKGDESGTALCNTGEGWISFTTRKNKE